MTTQTQAGEAGDALLDLDHKVHQAVKGARSKPVVKALGWISDIGDQPQARALSAGVLVLGVVRGDARMAAAGVRMLVAHELATAVKSAIKHRIDRKRPRSADDKGDEKPESGQSRDKEESSFPSGHSAGAMALASAFSAVYPAQRLPALAAAGVVAVAQIPRCAHYPTDVGAGLVIGAAADGVIGIGWRLVRSAAGFLLRR